MNSGIYPTFPGFRQGLAEASVQATSGPNVAQMQKEEHFGGYGGNEMLPPVPGTGKGELVDPVALYNARARGSTNTLAAAYHQTMDGTLPMGGSDPNGTGWWQ